VCGPVGPENGLDHDSVVNLDNVTTIPHGRLGARIGYFGDAQESALLDALQPRSVSCRRVHQD